MHDLLILRPLRKGWWQVQRVSVKLTLTPNNPMKLHHIAIAIVAITASLNAQTWVNGYQRSDGTQVGGHYRSSPNGNPNDNWSTKGNYNPYTGAAGTRNPTYGGGSTSGGYGSGGSYGSYPSYGSRR
jgi:hypothetical protein